MLIAWTASQWAHEFGIVAAALIAIGSVGYLVHRYKGSLWTRERELRGQAVATGLARKDERDHPVHRFRLLDLLAAITLVAALVGFVIGMMNEERVGIPPSQVHRWKAEEDLLQGHPQAPR